MVCISPGTTFTTMDLKLALAKSNIRDQIVMASCSSVVIMVFLVVDIVEAKIMVDISVG